MSASISLDDRDSMLSIGDAASLLACSSDTVRRMIARGELRAFRAGRLIRIRRRDLERALRPVTKISSGYGGA